MGKCKIRVWAAGLAATMLIGILGMLPDPAIQTVQAETQKTLKIGQVISVKKDHASYDSDNTAVAYVSAEGRVTAKSVGTATISIKQPGKTVKKTVRVVKNAKKPAMRVCPDEVEISSAEVTLLSSQETEDQPIVDVNTAAAITYKYQIRVTAENTGKYAIKKLVLTEQLEEQRIKLTAKNIAPKKKAKLEATFETSDLLTDQSTSDITFYMRKLEVYSGKMRSVYNYKEKTYAYQYATEDTKAPVIHGFIGKDSYNGAIPYQTIYSDQEKNFPYFKYVSAEDDRDSKVELTVDTSKVNFQKKGTYTITYIATDKAGNRTKANAKIAVRVNDSLDQMADSILHKIIKNDWSAQQKATAIYNYTRGHIAYTGTSDKSSWEKAAMDGIRYGRGDCFTYYGVARALLSRAGIPNIEVTRVQGHGRHWWNMAYVNDGFYHFDACPRKAGGRFCLVTDAQLKHYSSTVGGNSHIWAYDQKPKSPGKVISSIF